MRLYLVRHGQTHSNLMGILQGQLDTELTELGIQQAKNIAKRLKDHSFTKVFSSDLKRANRTAQEIARHVEIIYDERLRECHYGDFAGQYGKEVDWESLPGAFVEQTPPNGESLQDLVKRVKHFLDELEGEGNVLIVSHGGTIRALLHVLLSRDMEELVVTERPKNTSLYIIEKRDDQYIPLLENCDDHNKLYNRG
ncbi:MAG: histidine phosphatase family protein [Nanobdellota archaeon]